MVFVCSFAAVRMSVFHSGGNVTLWTTAAMDLMSQQTVVSQTKQLMMNEQICNAIVL